MHLPFAACCGRDAPVRRAGEERPPAEAAAGRCTADLPGAGGAHCSGLEGGVHTEASCRARVVTVIAVGLCGCTWFPARTHPRNRAPEPLWGPGLTANDAGVIPDHHCECSRSARGAPRRLSARAALHSRGTPTMHPAEKPTGSSSRVDAACAPKPATARTTTKAESTPPSHTENSGARVRLPIDLFEALDAGVRVDLRGADAGVTEQFLYGAQVRTAINQVRGETMTQ